MRLTSTLWCIPYPHENFVVYNDALHKGLGSVLMQQGREVVYASRQLTLEQNYHTNDLELTVVVFVLKIWRHYLYGAKFKIFTDHKSQKYLFDQRKLNMKQSIWV